MRGEWLVRTEGFTSDHTGAWQRNWKDRFRQIPKSYREGHIVLTMRILVMKRGVKTGVMVSPTRRSADEALRRSYRAEH
jgi:hypothetical protein